MIDFERLDIESRDRTPARYQIIVKTLFHGVLGCHRQLLNSIAQVAGGKIAEGEATRTYCAPVGLRFQVTTIDFKPSVLLTRKVGDQTNNAGVFGFPSCFWLNDVPVVHPDGSFLLAVLFCNPSPLRHFRSSP